jgi:hypothetical protein
MPEALRGECVDEFCDGGRTVSEQVPCE